MYIVYKMYIISVIIYIKIKGRRERRRLSMVKYCGSSDVYIVYKVIIITITIHKVN